MNMSRSVFTLFVCSLCYSVLAAQEPMSPSDRPPPAAPDLVELGLQLQRLPLIKNDYLRRESSAAIRKAAEAATSRPIEVSVSVRRVTEQEVIVEIRDHGRTRIVIEHQDLPQYGNLHTVLYAGTASTQRINVLSRPLGLRIGSEVELDVARKLRKGQVLKISGTIRTVLVHNEGWFQPHAIAIVQDWKVRLE